MFFLTDEKGKPIYPNSARGSPDSKKTPLDKADALTMEAMQVKGDAAAALMGKSTTPKPTTTQTSPTGKSPNEEIK